MFPTFIGILDIQSWWEVPSIAHFCSLFRDAFNLLDFDVEDLEEALLTDSGTEGHLLPELIVRLLKGCLPNDTRNEISTFNYQMFLRRLLRKKCQEYNSKNPFNTDVDFELLPLRQKVEILRALCDFRLDTKDVEESLSDLDSDSLRVEPLGHDRKNSAYWYFYGTRLYREDYIDSSNNISQKQKDKSKDKKRKKRRSRLAKEEEKEKEEEDCLTYGNENKDKQSIWQVVCFTLQDWSRLVEKLKVSEHASEKKLYKTLSEDFMPEIPKLIDLKEKQQRHKILQRSNTRIVQSHESEEIDKSIMVKSKIKIKSNKGIKRSIKQTSKNAKIAQEVAIQPVQKKGRQTNNSLASAVGPVVIDTNDEITDIENKKGSGKHGSTVSSGYGYKYNFGIEEEEQQVGMHKVLKILKDHEDAWPFIDPVDEQYAPRYYSVVRRPMDLSTMEEKLEEGSYKTISQFKRDFNLIIDNCKQYNGSDNEYTEMALNLKEVFNRAVDRYLEFEQSSDDSLSGDSSTGVNSSNYKNKTFSPSAIRHSQRRKHPRKLNKKSKLSNKTSKKKAKQKTNDNSIKEENEIEIKVVKVKDKKGRKKLRKVKSKVKIEDNQEELGNEGAISDLNVIKLKKKKSADIERTIAKNKKISVKEEIDEQITKSNKKAKKEPKQDKDLSSLKELKENRKRKDDFEENYEANIIPKSKSRKIEKKESKELDVLIDRIKKSKVKKEDSQDKLFQESKMLFSPGKSKKSRKVNEEKSVSLTKTTDKEKDKKIKKECELLKNGELISENSIINVESKTSGNKSPAKKFEYLVTKKDIESLDSLKDIISERRREEKLKLEQEKKKKQTLKSDGTSKKVPSNSSTHYHDDDKLRGKKIKSKKINNEERNSESKSQNQDENEPKKIKTTYSKHTKVSDKGNPAIQALNQATEQTLNDINKWLDDAPKLSEFSLSNDSPIFHVSTSDSAKTATPNKQQPVASTIKTSTTVTTVNLVDNASRKRLSSMKLFGLPVPVRPKKVQRTIDRLQPGKSKGNLLSKKPPSIESAPTGDTTVNQSTTDIDRTSRETNKEPKLSLGSVLKNVDSICKSLVSSPNPNLSNDDDDDEEISCKPSTPLTTFTEEQLTAKKTDFSITSKDEKNEKRANNEETQKPKSATPNLSAWFRAFGAPKSKKKEEEEEVAIASVKKEEILENSSLGINSRQRRISTGGSSVSGSISSFSQESPPSRTGRSPSQSHQPPSVLPFPAAIEPQIRGAGFYQDALSTGSSPYNSPYYTTPPRYSAQLPPTPSPQHHPLSPAYPSSAAYDQAVAPPNIYSQISPQTSHQSFQKPSPQTQSPTFSQHSPQNCYPQNSPQSELQQQPHTAPTTATTQNQSPVYPQQSPQSMQSSYSQASPKSANYSQPSSETQPPTPGYSQSSPQTSASNYSQLSPSQAGSINFSQSSPQQQHSSYSQSSPQPPPNYSQPSRQSQHSPFSQISPRPPSSTYSQPSPQPLGYSAQTPSPYSQPDLVIAQPSPQSQGYSQTSPQQSSSNYSQLSPQTPSSYSAQPSPQQQSSTFPQPSPQTPPHYSQSSPQQLRTYSHPSPQQTSQQPLNTVQQQQQLLNYSQASPQQQQQLHQQQAQPATSTFAENLEDYSQNLSTSPFNDQLDKSAYLQSSTASTPIVKSAVTKEKSLQSQTQLSTGQHLAALNQQIYQTASNTQYPPTYTGNVFLGTDRVTSQLSNEPAGRSTTSRLTNHETQLVQQKHVQQSQEKSSQLLNFQQNLASHESLYSTSFQTTPYPMPNAACRPVYSGYFDTSAKNAVGTPNPNNNLAPVKKRMYNESSISTDTAAQRTTSSQEQFGFDSIMSLAHPQTDVSMSNQFDSTFASSLADSVVTNPAYARLQLGLVARTTKETQQLLSIPRPTSKTDPLTAYARTSTPGQSELDLNLLQSLQNAAAKSTTMLSMSRRVSEQPTPTPLVPVTKSKKGKKSKQQQQQQQQLNVTMDQQTGIPSFPQYGSATSDPAGLKQTTVGGSAFNFASSAGASNSSPFYDKETSASAAAAAYAFLDDFRNPNLQDYYSMALRQQQQVQQQQVQQQQQQQHQTQQQTTPVTDVTQQVNKLTNQSAARNYTSHPFLHSAQRTTPYGPPVPSYVTPHGANLSVDPTAYQQYLHSLYALQPPPHHRPTWL